MIMMGTINCTYETPCGWCSKWDKKCDRKIPARGQRVDDYMGTAKVAFANKMCQSESDHEWECTGIGTGGTTYTCKKCHASKIIPMKYDELSATI
jgi:hypothetical protein